MTFIETLTHHLYKTYPETISELCIVFPNRRAGLFFKNALASLSERPLWAPEIYSIEDFITKLSETEILDPMGQLFELYEIILKIEKEKSPTFDDFLKWGQTLLADFNDIDSYLVRPEDLFGNLKSIKELENWSLGSDQLTAFQQEYLHFWKSLGKYYLAFREKLSIKKQAYHGLAYRLAIEKIEEKINRHRWHKIIFAGFNALNTAEELIFKRLVALDKAEVFWDADTYYVDNKIQEAGRFLRKYKVSGQFTYNNEKHFNWVVDKLGNEEKFITITGVNKNIGQAKLAGQLIQQMLERNPSLDLKKTAIVLGDENLLFPVLHSLPETPGGINVTMGYPLKNTPIAGFSELLFQLHENKMRMGREEFYYQDIFKLCSHPYTKLLTEADRLVRYIRENNITFCHLETIEKYLTDTSLFSDFQKTANIYSNLHKITEALSQALQIQWEKRLDKNKQASNIELEYLFAYSKIIRRIHTLSSNYNSIEGLKTFRTLLNQLIRATNLAFYGEPISGLQVMGMLETRTLDFENIILLSANEGVLPSGKKQNSFIPHDVRKVFNLPSYAEKDSIFAFHFYHLLQRAKNIDIVYNTEPGNLGGVEKSRFLSQLIYEFPQINKKSSITEQILEADTGRINEKYPILIPKTTRMMETIRQKGESGYSPSLLNIYRNCSLKFYFQLICKLREKEEVDETIKADTLGNVIHKTLEAFFKPFEGKTIHTSDLIEMKKQAGNQLNFNFEKYHPAADLSSGKNLLTVRVAQKFLNNFFDRQQLEVIQSVKEKKQFHIEQIEHELVSEITVKNQTIQIKGTIDRIDRVGSSLRIIDYKTGKTEEKELKVTETEELLHEQTLNKSFQLLLYAWLYTRNKPFTFPILSGIIGFRQHKSGLSTVKINGSDAITKEVLNDFEQVLAQVLEEIFNPEIPFTQTTDKKVCVYCDYKTICNR